MAKRREVIWTPGAKTDLDEVVAFIAKDAPSAGLTFLEEVLTAADSLETLSERGRLVPERASPQIRELFIKHYRLLYEIYPDEVHIPFLVSSTVPATSGHRKAVTPSRPSTAPKLHSDPNCHFSRDEPQSGRSESRHRRETVTGPAFVTNGGWKGWVRRLAP